MTKILHFTMGSVQSFVGQARRTRDLWSGSFLMSYMSGLAMKAVLDEGGDITFPAVGTKENPTDPLLQAILGQGGSPKIGSLPNRFKAAFESGIDFDPVLCRDLIMKRWKEIAKVIWDRYVSHAADAGNDTQAIWDTQIERFWDISWVIGSLGQDHTWIPRRKNWRTYFPPDQKGDHCTLMGDWQELSGWSRVSERGKREAFWKAIRKNLGVLDLGDHERLCAIALIKRLYPKIPKETIGWPLDVRHWPSTPYMAAIPWLKKALEQGKKPSEYVAAVGKTEWKFSERHPRFENRGQFARLDGKYFHLAGGLEGEDLGLDEVERQKLSAELKKLNDAVGGSASPFYALLLMDGDRLGAMLQQPKGEQRVSQALAEFTDKVEAIVDENDGVTIYAGGDDVLALLPLDGAIQAAKALRQRYLEAFGGKGKATISAAVVFAHFKFSLRAVLAEGHRLLDKVAKDRNGRDSVAITVLAGSGQTVEWVSTWNEQDADEPGGSALVLDKLIALKEAFNVKQFSSKFIYNVRTRIVPLVGETGEVIPGLSIPQLLKAEFLKNRERDKSEGKESVAEVDRVVNDLWQVCRRRHRVKDKKGDFRIKPEDVLEIEGALLLRFLARQEVGA